MSDQPWVAPGSAPAAPPGPATPPAAGGPPPAGSPPPPLAPPPSPYRTMEFRPGIIALRPLAIGDIYGGVLKAVRGNPAATIGLAALTTFAFLLPSTALGAWLAGRTSVDLLSTSTVASDTVPDGVGLALVGQYLPTVGQLFAGILLAGFLAQVVAQAVLGRKVGMGEVWRATRGRLLAMLGAVLLTILALLVVIVVCVAVPVGLVFALDPSSGGGIAAAILVVVLAVVVLLAALLFLSTKWSLATPAIVLEQLGAVRGLGRSWRLVGSARRSPFWRILGLRLLTGLIVAAASWLITLPISLLLLVVVFAAASGGSDPGGGLLVLQTVVTGISGLITGALTSPFSAGVDGLLYVDQRIRTEGLDVRLIQTAQGAAAPPWPLTRP